MSRGNYNGGSIIIGRSGWSTIDPAASDESDIIKYHSNKSKKLEKLQNNPKESSITENKSSKNFAGKLEEKILRNKDREDYAERVKRVEENNLKAVRNVEVVKKQKPKKYIRKVIHTTQRKIPELSGKILGEEKTELEGYLLLWSSYKKNIKKRELTKQQGHELNSRRARLKNKIFQSLPPPPEAPVLQKEVEDLNSLKKNIIKSWKNELDEQLLGYWNLLLPQEQKSYLFDMTGLGAFLRRLKKENLRKTKKAAKVKKTHKKKNGVSNLSSTDALRVIQKSISDSKKDTWDYKKTDWDLT